MDAIIKSPFFGIFITFVVYEVVVFLKKHIKNDLFNPTIITTIIIIILLSITNIPYENYNKSAAFLSSLLLPATCVLALNVYHQRHLLKKHFVAILLGCISGAITSIISIILLAKIFPVDPIIEKSILAKSITTAIAIDITASLNGIISITIVSVVFTGMIGAILAPFLIKLFKFDNEIAQGCAIGTASHALGTAKAIEIGEIQVAIASVSIIITGIATVLIILLMTLLN